MKKMLVLLAIGMLALTAFGAPSAPKGKCWRHAYHVRPLRAAVQVGALTSGLGAAEAARP